MDLIKSDDWLRGQYGVLGSMLISPELVPSVLSQMRDTDFSDGCVAVYQAIRSLFVSGVPVDAVSVSDKLGPNYGKFIMQLMELTPTANNYQLYVDLAKKQAKFSALRDIGQQMADATDADQLQELLTRAVSLSSANSKIKAVSVQKSFSEFFDRHNPDNKAEYVPWSISELDDQLFIGRGDFVIIGGKPSAGKTAFAMQCAWAQAKKLRVGFFSLETSNEKLTDRLVAYGSHVPLENIKRNALNDEHWKSASCFCGGKDSNRNLDIIAQAGMTVADIQSFASARNYDIIYIDYLQLLSSSGYSRYEQVTNLSLDLHRFSQSAGCTVIGLSQLSRGAPGEKSKEPDMGSLRESGQLEQDADAVLLLYLEDDNKPNGNRVLRCAKNKEGERFKMLLEFDGQVQSFRRTSRSSFKTGMAALRKQQRQQAQEQMQILPNDTPVPFAE